MDRVREVHAEVRVDLDRSLRRTVTGPSGGPRVVYGLRISYQRGALRATDRSFVTVECRDGAFLLTGPRPQWVTELVASLRPDTMLDGVRAA